jgi:hypothetical protein
MGNDFGRLKLIFGCGFYHGRMGIKLELIFRVWPG